MAEQRIHRHDPDRFGALRQIDSETAKAHQAFLDYVRMGAGRSIRALHASYEQQSDDKTTAKKPPTKTLRTIMRWSSRYNWQDRLKAYTEQRLVFEQALWEERRFEQRQQEWKLKNKLADSAEKMADWPIQRATVTEYYPDGRPKIVIFEPVGWNKGDAARFAKTSSELGRAAAEMVITQKHEHSGPGGAAIQTQSSQVTLYLPDNQRETGTDGSRDGN